VPPLDGGPTSTTSSSARDSLSSSGGTVNAAHDAELDFVRSDQVERAARGREPEVDLDRRMLLVKAGERRREQVGAGNARRGECERADLCVSPCRERAAGVCEQGLGTQDVVREHLPGRGQRRAAGPSGDELHPELGLERGEVLRDRGLADVGRLGGA